MPHYGNEGKAHCGILTLSPLFRSSNFGAGDGERKSLPMQAIRAKLKQASVGTARRGLLP